MSRQKVARVGRSPFERDTVADFPPLVRLRIPLLLATRAQQPGRDHGDDSASPHLIELPRPSRCVTPFVALALSGVASVANVERRRLQDAALKVTCPPRSASYLKLPNPSTSPAAAPSAVGGTVSPSVGKRADRVEQSAHGRVVAPNGTTERQHRITGDGLAKAAPNWHLVGVGEVPGERSTGGRSAI
jgi:hypothetical protein